MIKTYLSALLFLFATGCFADTPKTQAQRYWNDFRQAVITADYQKLSAYSKFPLAVHGVVDGIPIRNIGKDEFEDAMKKILDQPLASYEGDKLVTYTQRELVLKTIDLKAIKIQADKGFRIGELVFEPSESTYKLVRAYLSE